jgi:hypothetical protein
MSELDSTDHPTIAEGIVIKPIEYFMLANGIRPVIKIKSKDYCEKMCPNYKKTKRLRWTIKAWLIDIRDYINQARVGSALRNISIESTIIKKYGK